MKSIKLKPLVIITFLAMSLIANSQLIDPFGKVITHEIKLKKLNDGTYAGAIEWTTGGLDSLQRFIVKGLDVKAPVMVRITSKAPDHNIDLSFHKKNWDKIESKISTNGKKFADKVFRTMNIAGLGVRSEVAGIPYLITVKVGLQFPSTKSLIRITDDKEEYTKHLRKMGFNGAVFEDNNISDSSNSSSNSNSNDNNNTLTYVVIGLLAIIIILLIIKMKKSVKTTLLLLVFCSTQFCISQSSQPKLVPIDGQGNSPVFYEYRTSNVANQNSVPVTTVMNVGFEDIDVAVGTSLERRELRLDTAPGVRELTGEEAAEVLRRIKETNEQFDRDYGEGSPGEGTQGDQRTLPTDGTAEELNRLREQVEQLQQQVDLLSQEDEAFDDDFDGGNEVLLYCEDLEACQGCVSQAIGDFNVHVAYWNYLQHFYLKEVDDLNDKIEYGNTLASMPGYGIAWGPILTTVIRPAMNKLKAAYNKKFNQYIESLEADLEDISACYEGSNGRFRTNGSFEIQAYAIINSLKAARINK